jgi:uncharacterized protein DUF5666
MQTALVAATFAVVSIILSPAPYALAQEAKVARGVVTTVAGNSLTIRVRDQSMEFKVDPKTSIEAHGGGTKQRAATAAGKDGPTLVEVIKVGQSVAITYYEINGALRASSVREVANGTPGSVSTTGHAMVAAGLVQSIGDHSLTISGKGGGGASFTQTFTIDDRTRVFAKGASTATKASGGRAAFTTLVQTGDRVSVEYEKAGGGLHASDVRVTLKATH